MNETRRIDLTKVDMDFGPIGFLSADLSGDDTPFARIRYAINGEEQLYGLVYDLDKQVFLDHLEDPNLDERLQGTAGQFAEIFHEKLPPL